jgi:hypothetical protein
MKIHSTGGIIHTNMNGDLAGYGPVWFYEAGIANILSLARLRQQGYIITYSSINGNTFNVITSDGTERMFKQSDNGFFLDTESDKNSGVSLINTMNYNQYKYSNKSYLQALLAQRIQRVIGRPSNCDYIHILNNNLLPNIPISSNDITTAEDIFGPDIGSLKGKTTRKTPTYPYRYVH